MHLAPIMDERLMVVARRRTMNYGDSIGHAIYNGFWFDYSRSNGYVTCDDTSGGRDTDNALDLNRSYVSGSIINGESGALRFENAPSPGWTADGDDNWPTEDGTDDQVWASFLSSSNPSRPDISLPVFLAELVDLPKMIRHGGRVLRGDVFRNPSGISLAKEAASANLAYQYGWAPFASDLFKLSQFMRAVEKRRRILEQLRTGRGLRYRREFDNVTYTDSFVKYIHSSLGVFIPVDVTVTSTLRRWAVCHWYVTESLNIPQTDEQLLQMILGLTWNNFASNVWEAMPWSWLIDWFTNLGDLISLSNNQIGVSARGCVMTHWKKEKSHTESTAEVYSDIHVSSGFAIQENKFRVPYDGLPSISASLPILTGKQWSILGSLATLRAL
jgi:hypothetical protein